MNVFKQNEKISEKAQMDNLQFLTKRYRKYK